MKLERAQEVAKAKGSILQWNENFKVYDIVPDTGAIVTVLIWEHKYYAIRPSWLAIIEEDEFIEKYLQPMPVEGEK
jgi:hypothetical protein